MLTHFCLLLMKIKVPHPSCPSTRISIQVPILGIHFSPARYCRLMGLLKILYGTMETGSHPTVDNFQAEFAPWSPADLATDARILVWKVYFQFQVVQAGWIFLSCILF